jgi:hypothetical protein
LRNVLFNNTNYPPYIDL